MISWRREATLGIVLIALGLAILARNLELFEAGGAILGLLIFSGAGIVFLTVYRKGPQNWWAAIPAGVLFGLAAIMLLQAATDPPDGLLGAIFLWASAAAFLLLFRREPRFFWAAIPGGFLVILGILALVSGTRVGGGLLSWLIFWGMGAVFGMIFLGQPARWWAVIPAGVFFSLGFVELVELVGWGGWSSHGFIFNLGLAATFGFLFLIRSEANQLQWARFPAAVLAVVSLLFLFSALPWGGFPKILSLALVAGGLYLILSSRRSKKLD